MSVYSRIDCHIYCVLVQVTLDESMYRVAEDDGTVMIMVVLSQPSTQDIMVTVNSSDITATGEVVTFVAAIS